MKPHYRLHYVPCTFIGFDAWWVEGPGCVSEGRYLYGSPLVAYKYRKTHPIST